MALPFGGVHEGMRARHQSRGDGTVVKVDDYQYCYFKPDNSDETCYVIQEYLSRLSS